MNKLAGDLKVGDPCLAHVRFYPWWPALVVEKSFQGSKVRTETFHVVFYGTKEKAWLPLKELAAVSPDKFRKCVTPAAMKRK